MTRQPQATPNRRPPDGVDQATSREGLGAQVAAASRRLELEDPDRGQPLADRVVNRAVELVGVSLLAGILAIIFINALTRYALNYSFIWAEEVVIGLVPWLAVTGLFLSVRRRQMIQIEFFLEKFPPAGPRPPATLADLLGAVVLAWLAWLGFELCRHLWRRPDALSRAAQGPIHIRHVARLGRGRTRLRSRRLARVARARVSAVGGRAG